MLATYPEVFAGGAIVAGLPYGSATNVQEAFEAMAGGGDRSTREWGDLIRSASPYRGPWPKISLWHGSSDAIVNPRNMEASLKQWIDVHGVSVRPRIEHKVGGHSRRVWRTEADDDVIEAISITGMGHGVPVAAGGGSERCGNAGPFHFDVGVSSSHHIARFWGVADKATAKEQAADPPARADLVPVVAHAYEPPSLAARESASTSKSVSSGGATRKEEEHRGGAGVHDPTVIITAALKDAGLLSEPSAQRAPTSALDPRRIIASTLRSVGLLKE
jgi:hypothetical protein